MNRRHFIQRASVAAAAPFVVPRAFAPSDTLNVGVIGGGGMGAQNAAALAQVSGVRLAAVADVDMGRVAEAVAGRLASDRPEARAAGAALRDAYDGAARYADYREMLERENLDAVLIATPDHAHAPAALTAMNMRLHVYCQKPLTYTVDESRRLARAAEASGVVTQVGNQGHSGEDGRRAVEVVRAGVIGPVREVHAWTNRPNGWWPQGVAATEPAPVPEGLAWDLYLGANPEQPYRPGIHPFGWRGWVGFGVGSLGDMGAHLVDFPVWALDLPRPRRVETRHTPWVGDPAMTYPLATLTTYDFAQAGPAAGASDPGGPVRMTWYDGGLLPPTPASAPAGFALDPNGGVLYVGERGLLVHETYGQNPRFLPVAGGPTAEALAADAAAVAVSLPRVRGGRDAHEANWVRAIRGEEAISSPFGQGAHLNEIMLLGVAAMRAGAPITVTPEGQVGDEALLTRDYRAGWTLPTVR